MQIQRVLVLLVLVSVAASFPVEVRLWTGATRRFDHTSLAFAEAATEERKMAVHFNTPCPKWASEDLREVMDHWCLNTIPGWETYPETWGKDQYGQDYGGRFAYVNRNGDRLTKWLAEGNVSPFDALHAT